MTFTDMLPVIGILLAAVLVAGAIIATLSRILRHSPATAGSGPPPDAAGTVFLFHGGLLSDATPAARHLIAGLRSDTPSVMAVAGHLSRRFPDLRDRLRQIDDQSDIAVTETLADRGGTGQIRIESGHGTLRLSLVPGATPTAADPALLAALEEEVQTLRSIAEDAPQLIWQQDPDGHLIWANRAYLALADRVAGRSDKDDPLWPTRSVIPDLPPLADDATSGTTRVRVAIPGLVEPRCYEVASVRRGAVTIHFAIDASNIIAAEEGRQKFIQTLTKTFAHLASGLAIFDRDRRLVLFNPAFLDLTTLPADFLSQRPPVAAVLDRLRDLQMLPEPKNYTTWRDRVAALEAAAVSGTYSELWSLPSGRTYRVTGRPHPDGAIAFLFEDVSDEIHLTRHFRSELDTAQAVLDSLDEAVAVFSAGGTLTMSNEAYADLWGRSTTGLSVLGLSGEIVNWQTRTLPSPAWDRLRLMADDPRDRVRWHDLVRLDDGRAYVCRYQPLSGGATLVGFRPHLAEAPRLGPPSPATRPRAVASG